MIENLEFKSKQGPTWHDVVNTLTNQFVEHVLHERKVDSKLKEEVSYELKILLGLFIATKLNNNYQQEVSLAIVEYYFEDIFSIGNDSKYLRREIIELVSERHELYIAGLGGHVENEEDFLRGVAMHWFQFPLQRKDSTYVPFNYDFSRYFSDLPVVSSVLKDFAPAYAESILKEIKENISYQ